MSGMVSRTGVSDFVYVEKSVGMKIPKGSRDMVGNAYEANRKRLEILQKETDSLAKQVKATIIDFTKSSQYNYEFHQIESKYQLFDKGMSGYSIFPTFTTNEKAKEQAGKKCYFLLNKEPVVVVNFLKLPDFKQLEILKKVILQTVNSD